MCDCDKDKKPRGRGANLPRSGRQKPAASTEEIRSFIDNHREETGELPSLAAIHEELGGGFTRLTKIRDAYAAEHGIKVPTQNGRTRRPKTSDSPLKDAGLDVESLEKSVRKAVKEAVNTVSLQSTLSINDLRRDMARRMEQLEKNVRPTQNWKLELQSALIDTMAKMGLTQVIAPAIKKLVTEAGGRKRKRRPGRPPKDAVRPFARKPGAPPGRRSHPMERLAYERFRQLSLMDRGSLLKEAVNELDAGAEMDKGLALIRGCIRAAGGFEHVARATRQRLTSLKKAFGPKGSPNRIETMATIGYLSGVRI